MHLVGVDMLRITCKLFHSCISSDHWKNSEYKMLFAVWETFLYENDCKYNPNKVSYKADSFLSLKYETKTRMTFSASWWLVNASGICLKETWGQNNSFCLKWSFFMLKQNCIYKKFQKFTCKPQLSYFVCSFACMTSLTQR